MKFFRDFYGDYIDDNLAHVRLFSTARALDLPERELLTIFGGAFIALHERAAARAGKVRWADKNPENVLYVQQWRELLPAGFFFIHVVRHPLDALASLKEAGFLRTVPVAFAEKARLYKTYREAGEAYCGTAPETSITVAYEDLVTAPEGTLSRLFEFVGESFEPEVLKKFHLAERGSGTEGPKVAKTRVIHASAIGSWAVRLSPDEVYTAREILAPFFS